jgi:hypothetical protein
MAATQPGAYGTGMKMTTVFMLGTVSGAAMIGLWTREPRAYAAEISRRTRAEAAQTRRAVEAKTGQHAKA